MRLLIIFTLGFLNYSLCNITPVQDDERWRNFSLNVEEYMFYTKYFSVVDFGRDVGGLSNFLSKYLSVEKNVPLMKFQWKNEHVEAFSLTRQTIFILFNTVTDVNESFLGEFWKIVTVNKTSFLVIVIEVDENIDREILRRIWSDFGILEAIIVVPYPLIIYKYDVLDPFSNLKILNSGDKLLHNYLNLKKYPLRATAFENNPTYILPRKDLTFDRWTEDDTKIIGKAVGMDAFVMANMVTKLNFTPEIIITKGDDYGLECDNGTFTGSLKKVVEREVDISFNSRFPKTYHDENIPVEYSYPINFDEFCVLVPKAEEIPNWITLFYTLDIKSWVTIGIAILLYGFLWWITNLVDEFRRSFVSLSVTILRIMLNNPIRLPRDTKNRLFVGCLLTFNLIFIGLFQGSLNTDFSTKTFYKDIDSLEDLERSGLPVYSLFGNVFGENASEVGNRLAGKILPDYAGSRTRISYFRDIAIIDRKLDSGINIELFHTGGDGSPLIHVVSECAMSYHLVYIAYKGYPFLKQINGYIQAVVSAGLSDKWYRDVQYALTLKVKQNRQDATVRRLSLMDIQSSLYVLIFGNLFAIIAFFYELIKFKICERHPPQFEYVD